ncbi:MAG: hypothetical protein A2X77_05270 [Gammaproteobacteria bacterium GWE2_42_36]|nr:MAG: hypothetical protein A2X77_05270 [Gammaproteobacteria bacterium GWE2_42_36]HCU05286.1 hypothetical protein [Coxiellaceae bacterium]
MSEKLRSACGTDCKQCPAYKAKETNDHSLREKTAQEWNITYSASFTSEDINCDGCLSEGVHSGYCFACPIRACVLNKKIPYCYACEDFKECQIRKDFEAQGGIHMASFFDS